MAYRIEAHSKAWGVDPEALKHAWRAFVTELDKATVDADHGGTLVEGSITITNWVGDDQPSQDFTMTTEEARHGS